MRNDNFGLLIAYLVPGFVAIWGVSCFSKPVKQWLGTSTPNSPTVSGFLYVTLISVAIGLLVSTIRWAVIDTLHHQTGISRRNWDYSHLQEKMAAFEFLVANQYRYYQFYGNSFIAIVFTATAYVATNSWPALWQVLIFLFVEGILWMGSRDTLRNYYIRVENLLGKAPPL